MKLYELMNNTIIQGNVRLSVWDADEETTVKYFDCVDDLGLEKWVHEFEDLEIHYVFASPVDGFLHIELYSDEEA